MENNTVKYLLGIDGGGTKTEFALTDINKNVIKSLKLGASNPVNIGIAETCKVLKQGITEILDGTDYREVSVFAGLAGSASPEIKSEISRFLGEFGFDVFANGSDTDSTLELSLKGQDGILVIMGTGVVGFCQSDGVRHRIGGWGYLADNGGSGFHIGSDALSCAFSFIDGRGGSRLIKEKIENILGTELETAVPKIYSGGVPLVASFAQAAFDAYISGDACAEMILDKNIREVAKIIEAAAIFLDGKIKKTVICGGLCRYSVIIKEFLEKYIKDCDPEFLTEPAVCGAVALAEKNTGRGADNA